MTENKKGTGKGWREPPDPELGKAKRHHEVALKGKNKDAINEPIEVETEKQLCITIKKDALDEVQKYIEKQGLDVEIKEEKSIAVLKVKLPEKHLRKLASFIDSIDAGIGAVDDGVEVTLQYPTSKKLDSIVSAFVKKHEKALGDRGIPMIEEREGVTKVSVPPELVSAFEDFAGEQGLTEKEKDSKGEDVENKIIDAVQSKRKESAKAKDAAQTAKAVGSKENPEDLVKWIKDPSKSDLEGVDTRESKN